MAKDKSSRLNDSSIVERAAKILTGQCKRRLQVSFSRMEVTTTCTPYFTPNLPRYAEQLA